MQRIASTSKKKTYSANEERLLLLSRVADWAGISYGQLMLKSPAAREALILDYKAAKGGTP